MSTARRCHRPPTSSSPNQALQQTAGHDLFLRPIAHRCPAAAELGRSAEWQGIEMNTDSSQTPLCGREFRYNLSRRTIIGWSLFFTACVLLFGYQAVTDNDGVIFVLLYIPFTPFVATVTWIVCFGVFATVALRRRRIAFGDKQLTMPKSWWSWAEKSIPYQDLRAVRLSPTDSPIAGERLVYVLHKSGVECLSAAMFSSEGTFDDCVQMLKKKLNEHDH